MKRSIANTHKHCISSVMHKNFVRAPQSTDRESKYGRITVRQEEIPMNVLNKAWGVAITVSPGHRKISNQA